MDEPLALTDPSILGKSRIITPPSLSAKLLLMGKNANFTMPGRPSPFRSHRNDRVCGLLTTEEPAILLAICVLRLSLSNVGEDQPTIQSLVSMA